MLTKEFIYENASSDMVFAWMNINVDKLDIDDVDKIMNLGYTQRVAIFSIVTNLELIDKLASLIHSSELHFIISNINNSNDYTVAEFKNMTDKSKVKCVQKTGNLEILKLGIVDENSEVIKKSLKNPKIDNLNLTENDLEIINNTLVMRLI